jgi:CrcB protein
MSVVLVAIGGVAGVLARYGITRATLHSDALIWSTVAINVVGSFFLGLLVGTTWLSRDLRDAVGIGFLGGFTTFSTFSGQIVLEVDGGRPGTAAVYLVASVAGGIAAAAAGYALGRAVT